MSEEAGQLKLYLDPVNRVIRVGDEHGAAVATLKEIEDEHGRHLEVTYLDAFHISVMRGVLSTNDMRDVVNDYMESLEETPTPEFEIDPPYLVN